ncbi:MAG: hypothetical protein JNJ60_18710 [Rhodocyclaceae bacterium]|nr:hypothetical protein [Rhodocyclaceae bacterium]
MSVIRVLENIVQQIPQPASSFDPEVPPALDRVVLKSLSKSVAQRYGSAAEMARDLRMVERLLRGSAAAPAAPAAPPPPPAAVAAPPPAAVPAPQPAPPEPVRARAGSHDADSSDTPPQDQTVVLPPGPPPSMVEPPARDLRPQAAAPGPRTPVPPRPAPASKSPPRHAHPPRPAVPRAPEPSSKDLERTETGALPQYDFLNDRAPTAPAPGAPQAKDQPAPAASDDFADLAADLDAFSRKSEEQLLSGQGMEAPKKKPAPEKGPLFPSLHATPAPRAPSPPAAAGTRADAPAQARAQPAKPADPASSGLLAQMSAAAERIQQREDLVTRSKREMRQRAEATLPPTMRAAFQYFLRLCGHLDVVRPGIGREYPLLGAGAIRGLSWVSGHVDFRTRGVDGPEHINQILISYTLAGPESIRAERDGPSVQSLRRALEENGLHFEEDFAASARNRGESTVFTIFSEIKARILIRASYDDLRLRAILRNVERFATIEYEIDGARFDHAAWDEMGKLMLGQPSRFLSFAEPSVNRLR